MDAVFFRQLQKLRTRVAPTKRNLDLAKDLYALRMVKLEGSRSNNPDSISQAE